MNYCVYKIINKINNKYYIGVTSIERFNSNYYGSGKIIQLAIKKYGIDNFKKIMLGSFYKESDAYAYEHKLVNTCLVNDPQCYNITEGGGHPPKLFGEKNPNFGKDMSGKNSPSYGITPAPETLEKIKKYWFKEGVPGYWNDKHRRDETKRKISKTLKSQKILPPNAKTVLQYNSKGEFVREWRSAHKAEKELGIYHIGLVCKGKRKTAGGFFWKYK